MLPLKCFYCAPFFRELCFNSSRRTGHPEPQCDSRSDCRFEKRGRAGSTDDAPRCQIDNAVEQEPITGQAISAHIFLQPF